MAELTMTGKVARLYVRKEITYIRLDNAPASGPKGNYFGLKMDRPNYNALYSLALAAAANRWPLTVNVKDNEGISPEREAFVDYLFVDWQAPGE